MSFRSTLGRNDSRNVGSAPMIFVGQTDPQAEYLGLEIPDPDLRWNEERGHYDFGEIDWDEFRAVISGNGLCNRQRLEAHGKAHREGAWVREALRACWKAKWNWTSTTREAERNWPKA